MNTSIPGILFDSRDYKLLNIVNEVQSKEVPVGYAKRVFFPYFHPHGIKEMSETKGLRIAYAVVYLLHSLEAGKIDNRLVALKSLREEILSTSTGHLPKNTARVLLEIMKELVRSSGSHLRQLELAHDFRTAAAGKPSIIRALLRRYHLLELPEEWNQIVFDDHVHDVSTKGRKSATHLIMDAWIKGIRRLRVIYYNHIHPRSAVELMEAARIMGIDVRIGIEFSARFRGKYVQLIWVPRDFKDAQDFLCFLEEAGVMELMDEGRNVSEYQQKYVMEVLNAFNAIHRHDIGKKFNIEIDPIDSEEFLKFVGIGQASTVHLGYFIHSHIFDAFKSKIAYFRSKYESADIQERTEIERLFNEMNELNWETIVEQYLTPEKNPTIHNPAIPQNSPDIPNLLYLSPHDLAKRLASLRSAHRITLNLSNLNVADVLEILYECEGLITRLEIYNLKDHAKGNTSHIPEINALQHALNKGNVINLKRMIRKIIDNLKDKPDEKDRIDALSNILYDIDMLKDMYKVRPLKPRIGSDSTGRSPKIPGMGLAVKETLPIRAQREIKRCEGSQYEAIPFHVTVHPRFTLIPSQGYIHKFFFKNKRKDWEVQEYSTRMQTPGNIITLGGRQKELSPLAPDPLSFPPLWGGGGSGGELGGRVSLRYLNTWIKNGLKVLLGFIPAFATFFFTYDWWILAYLGAFIWFGITGLRNILQSVLGGGGIRRSPLLRWNDYISWERLTDSLLFTGFSVPLLDFIIKTLILNNTLGINTSTDPVKLYTFISIANGIYLSSHNAFRGLPRGAIFGNLFRSILSIPLAIAFNFIAGEALLLMNAADINGILQKWAAIISKIASDCVAGVIEGTADRYQNMKMRYRDYESKLSQIFDAYAHMEQIHPETRVLEILNTPKTQERKVNIESLDQEKIIMIHALDMMYFWMYQPRARNTFKRIIQSMSKEEQEIFMGTQMVLQRHREIAQLFIDGILGNNFMKPLAFYLEQSDAYLKDIQKMVSQASIRDSS